MSHLDAGVLHELLDGEIPSTELAPIQAHLAACAECRARLEEERQFLSDADGLVELLEVPAIVEPLPQRKPVVRSRTAWPRYVAWAASVVIAAGLGYSARSIPPSIAVRDSVPFAPDAVTRTNVAKAPASSADERSRAAPVDREARATRQERHDSVVPPAAVAQARGAAASRRPRFPHRRNRPHRRPPPRSLRMLLYRSRVVSRANCRGAGVAERPTRSLVTCSQ